LTIVLRSVTLNEETVYITWLERWGVCEDIEEMQGSYIEERGRREGDNHRHGDG